MKIKCSRCMSLNDLAESEEVKCNKCRKSFEGYHYSLVPSLGKAELSVVLAVLVGAGLVGAKVDNFMESSRYPLPVEYSIIDTCRNASGNMVTVQSYRAKREICLCALEETMSDISYSEYESDETKFILAFKSKLKSCQ